MSDTQQKNLTPADGLADLRMLADALDRVVADGHGDDLVAPGSDFDLSETIQHSALSSYTGTLHAHPVYGLCTKEQAARLQAMHLREHLPGLAALLADDAE